MGIESFDNSSGLLALVFDFCSGTAFRGQISLESQTPKVIYRSLEENHFPRSFHVKLRAQGLGTSLGTCNNRHWPERSLKVRVCNRTSCSKLYLVDSQNRDPGIDPNIL